MTAMARAQSNSDHLYHLAGAPGLQAGQEGGGSVYGGEEAAHYKAVVYYYQAMAPAVQDLGDVRLPDQPVNGLAHCVGDWSGGCQTGG